METGLTEIRAELPTLELAFTPMVEVVALAVPWAIVGVGALAVE